MGLPCWAGDLRIDQPELLRNPGSYNGTVQASSIFNVSLRVLGPALLGFATIFQSKANPTDHWSMSPKITIQVEVPSPESGCPTDEDAVHSPIWI